MVGEANVSGPLGTVGTRRSLCGAHGPVQGVSEAVLVTQPDQHTRREWSVVDPRLSAFCRTTSKLARRGRAFKTEGKAGAETEVRENLALFQMSEYPLGNREAELEHRSEKPPCVTIHPRLPKVGRACNGQG